jgi:hypothetical protein
MPRVTPLPALIEGYGKFSFVFNIFSFILIQNILKKQRKEYVFF